MRKQLFHFGVAGMAGFLADAGVLYLMLALGLGYYAGRVVSFLGAVFVTWQINRHYTFTPRASAMPATPRRARSLWSEWWRYLFAMSGGGAVNYLAYSATVFLLHPMRFLPLFAVAVGSVAGLGVNFVSAKFWVFRHR
ncbi:GtrA family protein [Trinickia mobilis]|uniref:GtrA family protein n=1 Tax=Trinickia mobilis TaxID=2816356 RepID=UPI001A8D5A59|nr:GtrA family protein [Trinickia mobilis]